MTDFFVVDVLERRAADSGRDRRSRERESAERREGEPQLLIPLVVQAQEIIAQAVDEGWTAGEIRDMFEQAIEIDRDRRTQATAKSLYAAKSRVEAIEDEPETKNTTPQAAAIVARHKLPRGKYGIGTRGGSVSEEGSSFDAVAAALRTGEACRLYRNAGGWRFVGTVRPDGTFVDERRSI